MGLFGGKSCYTADNSCKCNPRCQNVISSPQPNPAEFRFGRIEEFPENGAIVAEVIYPNCTNFEGRKVIVFQGISKKELVHQRTLDPHFSQKGIGIHIVARFKPTGIGWGLAKKFAKSL